MKKLLQFDPGETIITEGEVGESAYMIEDGTVEVSRAAGDRKVVLASLGKGEIFGEMSLIDECPRGATITATSAVTVSELPRDQFLEHLQTEPEFATRILGTIFERLREANVRILQLERGGAEVEVAEKEAAEEPRPERRLRVTLEGMTRRARAALPENPYTVGELPCLVGRDSPDPLVRNHLSIVDVPPWQISRHHLKLVVENGRLVAVDRGSTLGSRVDGELLGGRSGPPGPIALKEPEGVLVLGVKSSPYQYKVLIEEV